IHSLYRYTPKYYKVWVAKQKVMEKLHNGWDGFVQLSIAMVSSIGQDDLYKYLWQWSTLGPTRKCQVHPIV
ncbi:hypothetical protein J1N35_044106, partial [Gossypium stocksii]